MSEKVKLKRGRKPKVVPVEPVVEGVENQQQRVRKRGRRPLVRVRTFSEIQKQIENENINIDFKHSEIPITKNHTPTQVSWGNLNITIYDAPNVDTDNLLMMYRNTSETQDCSDIDSYKEKEYTEHVDRVEEDRVEEDREPDSESDINEESPQDRKKVVHITRKSSVVKKNTTCVKVENIKIYKQLEEIDTVLNQRKKWPSTTNILCWNCCHPFSTIPIPSVERYDERRQIFLLKGIFCSWNCSMSYTMDNCKTTHNLYRLYREWTGERIGEIKRAPSKFVLEAFGGYMSIDKYRNITSTNIKILIPTSNRMDYVNQEIIEIKTDFEKNKKSTYKLQRKKPPVNKSPMTKFI